MIYKEPNPMPQFEYNLNILCLFVFQQISSLKIDKYIGDEDGDECEPWNISQADRLDITNNAKRNKAKRTVKYMQIFGSVLYNGNIHMLEKNEKFFRSLSFSIQSKNTGT